MKPWAYLAILVAVLAAFGGTYAKGKSSGYDKRNLEVMQDIEEAREQERKDRDAHWRSVVDATEAQIVIEERIVEKIREVEIEVPTVVERIVEVKPECADLGDAYAGVLNNQVRAGNGIQIAAPTDPDDAGLQTPD